MASSSSQRSFSTEDLRHFGCIRLNDDVYEFYRPASGPISMEIVFFHGFQTRGCEDAFIRTWMTRDGSVCWLNTWLVESLPRARILSVSYDSSSRTSDSQGRVDMYLIRENLVHALVQHVGLGRDCPVVLVGHCVGGLVLKEICIKASQIGFIHQSSGFPHRRFLANLKGMFFYSTAHLGSPIPLPANPDQGAPLLRYLYLLNEKSARINHEFAELHRKYDWRVYGVNEANMTGTVTLMSIFDNADSLGTSEHILVNPEGSGRLDVDVFATFSGVDHFTICNPKDQQSNSFCYLVNFLEKILKDEDGSSNDLLRCLQVPSNLICFGERIDGVIELLDLRNPEQIRVSVIGMDGIGKSSLVKEILVRIQHQFDFVCFLELENVPRNQKGTEFEKLFSEKLYKGNGKKVSLVGETPWTLVRNKKVLIIVDDVEAEEQILPLLNSKWCGEGSRLIITTFIKGMMSQSNAFIEFQVPLLSDADAEKLFRAHVDPEDSLLRRIPKELVSQILHECEGLPLALKLVGHYLSRKENEFVWRDVLERLRIGAREALNGVGENLVWRKLKVIFDDFNPDEQRIFLDLATFDFFGPAKKQYDLDVLKVAWRTGVGSRGSFIDMTLENLRDRCFLQIVPGSWQTVRVPTDMAGEVCSIYIHKLLRSMGKWLSRILNEKGEFQHGQRVCELEDVKYVLNESKEDAAQRNRMVEVLSVAMDHRSRENLKWSSIGRFEALRLLRMSNVNMSKDSDMFILPRNLAMLHMIDCSGPKERRRYFWPLPHWPIPEENVECLSRLSVLLLDNCRSVRLPKNFHKLKQLQILQIHDTSEDTVMQLPETLGLLPALEQLSLSAPVEKLPDSILALPCLKSMELRDCSTLKAWPIPVRVDPWSHLICLTSLKLSNLPALTHLPDTFGGLRSLRTLWLIKCPLLERLPEGFSTLQQLTRLRIDGCEKLESLCESFDSLHNLEHLDLMSLPALRMRGCSTLKAWPIPARVDPSSHLTCLTNLELSNLPALTHLPGTFGGLRSLRTLRFYECPLLERLPEGFSTLQQLTKLHIDKCEKLESLCESFNSLHSLERLYLWNLPALRKLPNNFGYLPSLKYLAIRKCTAFTLLPESFIYLQRLSLLYISKCENLVSLWQDPGNFGLSVSPRGLRYVEGKVAPSLPESIRQLNRLREVILESCKKLQYLPRSLMQITSLEFLEITHCGSLVQLPDVTSQLSTLTDLRVENCLPESVGELKSLKTLILRGCKISQPQIDMNVEGCRNLPESLGQLIKLEYLRLKPQYLVTLPESIGQLTSLRGLVFSCCVSHLPDSFGQLVSLESLELKHCENLHHLPDSFGQLVSLKHLELKHCENLHHLPDSFGQLVSLESLELKHFENLHHLPDSFGQLVSLKGLELKHCENLHHLPDSFGQLVSLKGLELRYCEKLHHLPDSFGQLVSLEQLELVHCGNLHHMPDSLCQLSSLEKLTLEHCGNLHHLPDSFGQLVSLKSFRLTYCENLHHLPDSLCQLSSLEELHCSNLHHLPDSFGQLVSLKGLELKHCENLHHLPDSFGQLVSLKRLELRYCEKLHHLPDSFGQLVSLEQLELVHCGNLHHLPDSLCQLSSLEELTIEHCGNFRTLPESLGHLPLLSILHIRSCENLVEFPKSMGQLRRLSHLELLKCGNFERLSQSIGHLKSLTSLTLGVPTISEDLLVSLGQLTKLKILRLPACENPRRLVYILEQFTALSTLCVSGNYEELEALFKSLRQLPSLRTLEIRGGRRLEKIPESLGQLSQLQELHVERCRSLKELLKTLGELAALRRLFIHDCKVIKTLHESIGLCKTLEVYTIGRLGSWDVWAENRK